MLDWSEVTLRLGAAALAGGALGLNRDLHGKAVGVRTLGIVALATSSMVVMADSGGIWKLTDSASRLIQGILTGVGFLGAGVIIHAEPKGRVRGLTSAACTWLTACIGIVCGSGQWRIVVVASAITFALLIFGGRVEKALHRSLLGRRAEIADKDLVDRPP
jgi:putative Mg2+ transporter-C (MgtC) family protein